MFQVEAARSAGVRFYMPCHNLDVLVCVCVRGGRQPRWLFDWRAEGPVAFVQWLFFGSI